MMLPFAPRPRRSLLFVPANNARAMQKARSLPADVIIFDLEDAVHTQQKQEARESALKALKSKAYGHRERVVRINDINSRDGLDDLIAIAQGGADALLLPKVTNPEQVAQAASMSRQLGASENLAIWANVETPLGVINAAAIAAVPECAALVMGTNDLRACLGISHDTDRTPLLYSLSAVLCAARAYGKLAFDGTFINLGNLSDLESECIEGKKLGFDGKTLIHPEQIDITNQIFTPTKEQLSRAHAMVCAYETAQMQQSVIAVSGGQMVETLHIRQALRTIKLAEAIEKLAEF